ncbi:MAG: helix-turn-helix transcriptional regulator [Clostridia bacterium]|nr:helix-turn-helix transcriptional regulator [Clostridia bacterium]
MREALKNRRLALSLTQKQLAEIINIKRSTYTNIERGNKCPSFNVALKIKQALEEKDDKIFLNSEVAKRNKKPFTKESNVAEDDINSNQRKEE